MIITLQKSLSSSFIKSFASSALAFIFYKPEMYHEAHEWFIQAAVPGGSKLQLLNYIPSSLYKHYLNLLLGSNTVNDDHTQLFDPVVHALQYIDNNRLLWL